jgi:TnpA family transposase
MIKSTIALQRGTATAEAILKRYNSYNTSHPTYKALAEVGKAEKTVLLQLGFAHAARLSA